MNTPELAITNQVQLGPEKPPLLLAGPCVIEGPQTVDYAIATKETLAGLDLQLVFKASFDKANRTSISGERGIGLTAGLEILAEIKERLQVPIVTDVHLPEQCAAVAEVCDILQIPAFLCRQTDLINAAAATGKTVNIKKGQFLSPRDAVHAANKARAGGNNKVMLTERGTFFGYGRLVVDFAGIPDLRAADCPLIFDATHSVQAPGGLDGKTGGDWKRAPILMRAAAACGFDGFFVETHPEPALSPSDAANMIPLSELREVIEATLAHMHD